MITNVQLLLLPTLHRQAKKKKGTTEFSSGFENLAVKSVTGGNKR